MHPQLILKNPSWAHKKYNQTLHFSPPLQSIFEEGDVCGGLFASLSILPSISGLPSIQANPSGKVHSCPELPWPLRQFLYGIAPLSFTEESY